ncbi:MAG: long-chain fatty acid--CoA ligase [Pseudomonadota bacterium]
MLSLMQDAPLLVSGILDHARRWHGNQEVVGHALEGGLHRQSYRATAARSCQLAHALTDLGAQIGTRIGIIAWNTHRHLELWYGVSGIGAVAHDINPRLSSQQLAYIIGHAHDEFLFVDITFAPLVAALRPQCPSVKHVVVMTDAAHQPEDLPGALIYEDLIAGQPETYDWPQLDERSANALCYTSGTTGNPKGVLYSHRSNVLHALGVSAKDGGNIGARDVILPAAPMFHANGWGIPYAALAHGAKLVFTGRHIDGPTLHSLIMEEGVTLALGVPTIALALLEEAERKGDVWPGLERFIIAGSAAPLSMIEAFDKRGVEVVHCWGMTETSPIGTSSAETARSAQGSHAERIAARVKQGRPVFGVDLKITASDGTVLPHDGQSIGALKVRGPWVLKQYFGAEGPAVDTDGWFDTGDIACIDEDGFMQITDRAKDLIKSGGEWISSVDLENMVCGYDKISQAAVIGVPHPKWDERPVVIAVANPETQVSQEEVLDFLKDKVAKLWLPDTVIFTDALPLGATGKVQKSDLRAQYADLLQSAAS